MRITIESLETLSNANIEEIVDIWNRRINVHYFNFQLHVGFKNLYQNFQGGAKTVQGGGKCPLPSLPRLNSALTVATFYNLK